ncbi:MAG: efflux RND transporter permease subunit, partial [Phycisphaerae bacterium]
MRRPLASLIALGVRNPVMANLAMVCILAGGYLSVRGMVRETYPVYTIGHIGIDTLYPGAGPIDVEESITVKVEKAIKGLPGIREVSSSSTEGRSTVYAVLQTDVGDPGRVLKNIQDQVDRITTFPAGAQDPVVSEWVLRQQVINIAISGDLPERTLKSLAEQTRDDLLANAGISQISLLGVRDYEISIEVSEESLQRYGLSFADVIAAVKRGSVDLPAGTLRTANQTLILRTTGQRRTGAEFEQLAVISAPDGTLVRLGQIAAVRDTFEETPKRGWFNGQPATMVAVYKTQHQDTSNIARIVKDYVAGRQESLPPNAHMQVWAD